MSHDHGFSQVPADGVLHCALLGVSGYDFEVTLGPFVPP